MAKVTNNFLKGKMNKDLDERLVPKGEYREAQNILITQSEDSDVGAIENILGNALAKGLIPGITGPLRSPLETIGYHADISSRRVFWFITDFSGNIGDDIRTMTRPTPNSIMRILMAELDNTSSIITLASGHFLNFSKNHLITGVNLIDDLLFWTDNYNQPRKINITKAKEAYILGSEYYTKEEQISVAKVAPYLAPILYNRDSVGDGVTLKTNNDLGDDNITSDYLKDRFVRFSYRYKYEDGEYTTMAPFTQIIFKPLNDGQIMQALSSEQDITDVQDAYSKTIINIMKNNYRQIELRIPLPGDENSTTPPEVLPDGGYSWANDLHISKIEILVKESDQDVVKVIKEIDVTNDSGDTINNFLNNADFYIVSPEGNENYFRHVYKFIYKSEEPYKILEDKQITRVYDQVPLRSKAQEISGNRLIYGNFTENYNLPKDEGGKTGINYTINDGRKGDIEFHNIADGIGLNQYSISTYKYNSLKQRRTYQVGVVLADKFGRQSSVILSTNNESNVFDADTITVPNLSEDLTEGFNNSYSWSALQSAIGKTLNIEFKDSRIIADSDVYNGDIDDRDYNPYGWYSWKLVVKQQEQEYDNIYTSHPADYWNNESNSHDEVLGYTWVSLYGDNINKVPRDVSEVSEITENVAGSDVKLFPKVIKFATSDGENISTFGDANQDPLEVMTVGTAREQNILTKGDRDKDRVHDFVMSKRNPLLAQIESMGTNNRVRYRIDARVRDSNEDDKTYIIIGDGNTINPYIREGHEITSNQPKALKAISNIAKKVLNVTAKTSEQNSFESRVVTLDGQEIEHAGGDAKLEAGQIMDFRFPYWQQPSESGPGVATGNATILVASDTGANENYFETSTNMPGWDFFEQMLLAAYEGNQITLGGNVIGPYETLYAVGNTYLPMPPPTLDVQTTVEENYTILNGEVSGNINNSTPEIYFIDPIASFTQIMPQGSVVQFLTAQELEDGVVSGRTTATIEEHGDHFNIRRPILQKVEINQKENRSILHFDRNVFENLQTTTLASMLYLAMYDPITVKNVETITEIINDEIKYFQKIKMSHEVFFAEEAEIVIQNLETEPISVRRGLTVLETDPVKSNLDIFYETSTSGLIKDLNELMAATVTTGIPVGLGLNLGDLFYESVNTPFAIGELNATSTTTDGTITYFLESVTRGNSGDNVTSYFSIEENVLNVSNSFHFKPEEEDPNANTFYVTFQALDSDSGLSSSVTNAFVLLNSDPSIEFNSTGTTEIVTNAGGGSVLAAGTFNNGSSNANLDAEDITLEVVNIPTWSNGLPIFSITQVDGSNNFELKIINQDFITNTVSYLETNYADTSTGILSLTVKVTDAGELTDTATITFNFGAIRSQVYFVDPEQSTDSGGICDIGMESGSVYYWVSQGSGTQPATTINTWTSNYTGVNDNLLNLPTAYQSVYGVQLYVGNKIYTSSNGYDNIGEKNLKYFKTHVDYTGIGADTIDQQYQWIETDSDGIITTIQDCPLESSTGID